MKHSITLIAVSALLTLASCQKTATEQQTATTTTPSIVDTTTTTEPALPPGAAATEEIGHYAENLYDWARTGDWPKAQTDLAALKTAVTNLESTGQVTDRHGADEHLAT